MIVNKKTIQMRPSGTGIRPGDYSLWKQKYWSHIGKKNCGSCFYIETYKFYHVQK